MDSNGSYSFDENALQQKAFTDLFALDENFGFEILPDGPLDPMFGLGGFQASQGAMQQPASDSTAFSLNNGGLNFDTANTFNQPLGSMNGPFPALDNYPANNCQSFNQTASQGASTSDFWSPDNNDFGFGAPYSFNQATLPQGSVTDTSAFNATANDHAFGGSYSMDANALNTTAFSTGSDLDAPFEIGESEDSGPVLTTKPMNPCIMVLNPCINPGAGVTSFSSLGQSPFDCDWPGCNSKEAFTCNLSRSRHISAVHIQDVLNNTSGSCTWPGCTKSELDTRKKLETHVTNIHINPLRCTMTGCKRTEPFGRKGDLERHIASVHKHGRTWKCPHKTCKRHTNGFPRKDKLNEHSRTTGHGAIRCPYHHCCQRYHLTEARLSSHINDHHGTYECALGSCASTVSAFSLYKLTSHLLANHLSFRSTIENLDAFVQQSGGDKDAFTLSESHLGDREYFEGCRDCTKRQQTHSE
ncbi:Transcription factor IIIA [Lachnellula subtilissima]|uniref:Transcription factor IIIA n=1 Tax=Lachnellula subtilissima TaxID=602034 RepID=A0A8H8UIS0_9HELO|nr:Transcription factor IIIA [Lachnellula subtilissima]